MNKRSRKGFTIIEMVIVITIIGILAAVLIPTYSNVVSKANASSALQTARSTMVNWLAESGLEDGRPVAELREVNGAPVYAAYFQYTTDRTYQFRYANGSIEEVTDTADYLDFEEALRFTAYLENMNTRRANEDLSDGAYQADIYIIKIPSNDQQTNEYVFYTRYAADAAYSMGGADVLAYSGDKIHFYNGDGDYYECRATNGKLYLEKGSKQSGEFLGAGNPEVFNDNDVTNLTARDFVNVSIRLLDNEFSITCSETKLAPGRQTGVKFTRDSSITDTITYSISCENAECSASSFILSESDNESPVITINANGNGPVTITITEKED